MNIYLLLILLISLIGINISIKKFNNNYLNKENTSCIKGIFILIVFYSHFVAYSSLQYNKDFLMYNLKNYLGQLMVAMFLFYSGYGIYESFKNKGQKYISSIPKNRILKTLFHFDIIVIIFAIINAIMGTPNKISTIFLSLTGWESVGNSNWYIFAIVCLYLTTYISFSIFDKKPKHALIFNWILSITLFILLAIYKGPQQGHWYNTLICYPFGLTYSYYNNIINKYLFNNKKYIMILLITLLCFISIRKISYINEIWYSICSILFVMLILLFTTKIEFKSPILKWFGNNLFWVYILQRIPMNILSNLGYAKLHSYRFFIISFACTLALTFIFSNIFKIIDNKLFNKNTS